MDRSSSATADTSKADQSNTKMSNSMALGSKGSSDHRQSSAGSASSAKPGNQISRQSSASAPAAQATTAPAPRDGSPSRQSQKTASSTRLAGSRSRNNSQQDLSPTRQAQQRARSDSGANGQAPSSTATPTLGSTHREASGHVPAPRTLMNVFDLKESSRWPVSPRLRSPPSQWTASSSTTPLRTHEIEAPTINVQQPSPSPRSLDSQVLDTSGDADDLHAAPGPRTGVRGLLETVQEVSQNTPSAQRSDSAVLDQVKDKLVGPQDSHSDSALSDASRNLKPKANAPAQPSVPDAVPARAELRRTSSVPPSPLVSRHSSALSAKQGKSKPEAVSTQSMTVETETVVSIPQVGLTTSSKDGSAGTLRGKPSTETIKPKKDKKKVVRKQPLVNVGAAASKADNFEAKIANAVDEANTSDSEETFVYDSNPPDNTERSNRRFHSRTPSATSMVSQAERQNLRSIYGVMEGASHGPVPKKSMKFVNTFGGGNASDSLTPGDEDGKGSGRSGGGSTRGTVRHHHHIGRWGRQPGNGHASLFDNESPFPNASKSNMPSNHHARNPSGPPSPRNFQLARGNLNTKRSNMQMSSTYDMDETTGADDERTPLVGTLRSTRWNRNRRGPHNLRQAESQTYTRRSSYLNRFAACLVLTMMLLLVITGAIGFMFATSQPLTGIDIVSIENVVTSEQVLMFDLTVKAHNPNIVVITMDHANLEIFAKSEHAGTDSDWWKNPDGGPEETHLPRIPLIGPPTASRSGDGDGEGDGEGDGDGDGKDDSRPNILLGRITEFDSPLVFEGSLFHQGSSSSTGEMQLPYPGNGTSGGSERWERIYQNKFDLIVKGVVRYRLPLSAHVRSATVSGRTTVKPNSANDPSHKNPNGTTLGI